MLTTTMKKSWIATLLALVAMTLAVPIVLAHATLLRSEPANNAILADPPQLIRLWFSETISPEFSSAQIFDIHGQPIDGVDIHVDPAESLMTLTLPELPHGLYNLRWKVLSEVDGHFTQGPVIFGVGAGVDLEDATAAEPAITVPLPEVGLRWFNFSGVMGVVGAVVVAYLVLGNGGSGSETGGPIITTIRQVARRRVLALALGCSGLVLVANMALLAWQVNTLLDTLPEGVSGLNAGWQLLSRTRWGMVWIFRQIILLALSGGLFFLYREKLALTFTGAVIGTRVDEDAGKTFHPAASLSRRQTMIQLLIGPLLLGLLISLSLTSHAAAITPTAALPIIVDVLHLLSASLWVGGLLALVVGLLPLVRRDSLNFSSLVRITWAPFSRLAALSVVGLVATGLYSTGQHVASIDALIATLYGQALLAKIGLMLGVGLFGLLNTIVLHPTAAAPLARWLRRPAGWTPLSVRRLPILVLSEMTLALLVVLATGIVTAAPTARGPEFEIAPDEIPTILSQTVDDMLITFSASPNKPGQNVFAIRAVSTRRPPPAEILRVILRFTFLGQDMGRITTDAVEIEPGLYQAGGSYLSLAGPWQVQVVVRRGGIEDSIADFHWVVAPAGEARPTILSKRALEPILTIIAAITILGLLLIILGLLLRHNRLAALSSSMAEALREQASDRNEANTPIERENDVTDPPALKPGSGQLSQRRT